MASPCLAGVSSKRCERVAGLQSEFERLNAVNPQLRRVEKAKGSVLVVYRQAGTPCSEAYTAQKNRMSNTKVHRSKWRILSSATLKTVCPTPIFSIAESPASNERILMALKSI